MSDSDFSIVGIGASAGGIEAFHSFFDHMPVSSGMAFVLILHLPADRKSLLPEIVGRWTTMRVLEAVDGALIEPNTVYVPPPHAVVTLSNGRLGVRMPGVDDARVFRPIDAFFDALGRALGDRSVGIVLSGTGSDGALGLKAIKECGGLTIAQGSDGSAPQYGEMPAGAIATGSVDLVLSVEEIPARLMHLKGSRLAPLDEPEGSPEHIDAARLKICGIIRTQLGHDFSGYRDKTFLRRVQRRMQVVNAASLDVYMERLQSDHHEVVFLFRDLLIRVTSFFRDQETFETLQELVVPRLFAGKGADGSVRVWIPGCATGEEAYSLAILLREHMDRLTGPPKVQLFATDIDGAAIAIARLGRYPAALLEGLSAERRNRFFSASQNTYLVSKEIRDLCTFSEHNLVRDPPFSRMDMVSCRNLLIYMDVPLQASVIPAFHYSLVPDGVLLLGGSESVAKFGNLFDSLDKTSRIFQKRNVRSPPLDFQARSLDSATTPQHESTISTAPLRRANTVVSHERPYRNEPRQPFQAPAPGSQPSSPHVPNHSQTTFMDKLNETWARIFRGEETEQLRRQLSSTQEQLQSLAEEHQTALEELRSSNEELHSVNEEIQSTNEELETSKEELQSVNEELNTVNLRLTEKINELDQTNSDLRNLFESTEIATVFLDRHLVIRSFTPAIASLYNLIPSDQGRPLTDIVSHLNYQGLREDVPHVLQTLEPLQRRIARADQSTHYIMRILPYREPDSTVSGVLVTFVDVTSIVQAEEALVEADLRKDVFLATLSHELRNPLAPIRNAARLLESPSLAPDQLQRARAIISRQVTHMSSLLDDLLDVSRITRGAFTLKKEHVDLHAVLNATVEAVQGAMDAKSHRLQLDMPAMRLIVEVDPVRITQVVSNLLTNAAKYTPSGGLIRLGFRLEPESLRIFVRDNGMGLSPEMLTQVFNMFTRVDADRDSGDGGLGIGLALAKGLVELHGGSIEARSAALGQGSEFIISLPRSSVIDKPQPSEKASAPGQAVKRNILVADDNEDGADTLAMYLTMSGHDVHVVYSGEDALKLAADHRPDVALLDIGMPGMTGYEVAKRLRREAWGAGIHLIAMTGWGQDKDKRMARDAGFDHHLTKPVDLEQLAALLERAK